MVAHKNAQKCFYESVVWKQQEDLMTFATDAICNLAVIFSCSTSAPVATPRRDSQAPQVQRELTSLIKSPFLTVACTSVPLGKCLYDGRCKYALWQAFAKLLQ